MRKVRILFIEDNRTDCIYEFTEMPSINFFAELIKQMFMKYICFFLIIFLAISCKRNIDQQSFDQVNIFVEDSLYNYTRSFLLSEVVENISIIPLETKKESVFNNRIFSSGCGWKVIYCIKIDGLRKS